MIINKEEVEKAAEEYGLDAYKGTGIGDFRYVAENAFKAGVEFSEEYVQKYIGDIITENQGLNLYKDNEAKRFKELAVEFLDWYQKNTTTLSGAIKYWDIDLEDWVFKSNKEIFETYKEKNEKN